jgi:hypothetical protein
MVEIYKKRKLPPMFSIDQGQFPSILKYKKIVKFFPDAILPKNSKTSQIDTRENKINFPKCIW